jgi:hypothetical protein
LFASMYIPKLRSVSVNVSPLAVVGVITVEALELIVTLGLNPFIYSLPVYDEQIPLHAKHPVVISNLLTVGLPHISQIGELMPKPILPAPPPE